MIFNNYGQLFKRNSLLLFINYYLQAQVTIQEANAVVGSQESMYTALIKNGIYLQDYNSDAISSEYLLNVALRRRSKIQSQKVRQGQVLKNFSKLRLYIELDSFCRQKQFNLGISEDRLPDKKWLLNVLYSINPENEIFTYYQDCDNVIGLTKDDLTLLKQLAMSLGRHKNMKFFKRTSEQLVQRKKQSTKKKISQNTDQKRKDANKIEEQIKDYEQILKKNQSQDQ